MTTTERSSGGGVWLHFVLGTLLAAALLWFVQGRLLAEVATEEQSGWSVLLDALTQVRVFDVALYFFLFFVVHLLRVARWVIQVRPLGERDHWLITRVAFLGFGAIEVLPFRLGEIVRPYLLARESPAISFSAALGTAVVERVVDGLFITLVLFLAVLFAPHEGSAVVYSAGKLSAVVFLAASVGLALFVLARPLAEGLLHWSFGLLDSLMARFLKRSLGLEEKVLGLLEGFVDGVRALRGAGSLLHFLLLTVLYWTANAFSMWLFARAFGLIFPWWGAPGLLAVLVIGLMTPSGPGYVGTFQLFLSEGLRLYLPVASLGAAALAFALMTNLLQFLVLTLSAVPFLSTLRLGQGGVLAIREQAAQLDRPGPDSKT